MKEDFDLHRLFITLFSSNKYMLFLRYIKKIGFKPREIYISNNKNKKKLVINIDEMKQLVKMIEGISDIDKNFSIVGYRSLQKQKECLIVMIDKAQKFKDGH